MKILDWIKVWLGSWGPGPACYFCGAHESDDSKPDLYRIEHVSICRTCLLQPMGFMALESLHWQNVPWTVPGCMNCLMSVPQEQLEPAVRRGWYFCGQCASDREVRRYWERVSRKMWERRARISGVKVCR